MDKPKGLVPQIPNGLLRSGVHPPNRPQSHDTRNRVRFTRGPNDFDNFIWALILCCISSWFARHHNR